MRTISIVVLLVLGAITARADATPDLAARRARQLARLRAYLAAGELPTDDAGRPASVFRDANGRLCPMAYLIAASGHADLVDRVARTDNTLRLADVTDGPLWDWMLTSGLTREEIIRIQGILLPHEMRVLPRERERPTIVARVRSSEPRELRRAVLRRGAAVLRTLEVHDRTSLAVAESRLPRRLGRSRASR